MGNINQIKGILFLQLVEPEEYMFLYYSRVPIKMDSLYIDEIPQDSIASSKQGEIVERGMVVWQSNQVVLCYNKNKEDEQLQRPLKDIFEFEKRRRLGFFFAGYPSRGRWEFNIRNYVLDKPNLYRWTPALLPVIHVYATDNVSLRLERGGGGGLGTFSIPEILITQIPRISTNFLSSGALDVTSISYILPPWMDKMGKRKKKVKI